MKKNITLKGYNQIVETFEKLKKEKDYWVKEKQIAATFGDRSENAEYISAKENIRNIDRELFKLNRVLENTLPVDISKRNKKDFILFGSIVVLNKISDEGEEEEMTVEIVGTEELVYVQKVSEHICISNISPLGKKLLMKKEEEEVDVNTFTYEILKIIC